MVKKYASVDKYNVASFDWCYEILWKENCYKK
jgi:hypothetical protein